MTKELAFKLAEVLHKIRFEDDYAMTLDAFSRIGSFVKKECTDTNFSEKEFYDKIFQRKIFDCQFE